MRESLGSFTVGDIAAAATTFYRDRVMSERLPMIVVDQLDASIDVPIAIELRGFAPRQAIILPLALLLGATFPEINAVSAWVPSVAPRTANDGRGHQRERLPSGFGKPKLKPKPVMRPHGVLKTPVFHGVLAPGACPIRT
jgi:hypothetical protein